MADAEAPPPPPPLPELGRRPRPSRSGGVRGEQEWWALLQNRFLLGGTALLVVLLLITIVLVLLGGGDDQSSVPSASGATTPGDVPTVVLPAGALAGRMTITASVRSGPDFKHQFLGTARRGAVLAVVGRNQDASWLQIIYPPGSRLRGWIDATFMNVTGDVDRLVLAQPNAGPVVEIPDSGPFIIPTVFTPDIEPTKAEPRATSTPRRRTPTPARPTRTPRNTPMPQDTPTSEPPPTDTPTQ